jgi:8-oxo-dGTP pyrophosphatase MutT (NUDIX family)
MRREADVGWLGALKRTLGAGGPDPDRAPVPVRLDALAARLAGLSARRIPDVLSPTRAAVAIVLREGAAGVEVLLIERARRHRDPWSGHMAFPGGRADSADEDPGATAARETREEIGLDLGEGARRLGRLHDVQARAHGRPLPMAVTPVVFALAGAGGAAGGPELRLKPDEVASSLWVPLDALRSGRHDERFTWRRLFGVWPIRLACWRYEGKIIWGLTYRMLSGLLALAEP